jgi:hypothetical protein
MQDEKNVSSPQAFHWGKEALQLDQNTEVQSII